MTRVSAFQSRSCARAAFASCLKYTDIRGSPRIRLSCPLDLYEDCVTMCARPHVLAPHRISFVDKRSTRLALRMILAVPREPPVTKVAAFCGVVNAPQCCGLLARVCRALDSKELRIQFAEH